VNSSSPPEPLVVSVVIPTRNRCALLSEALRALSLQVFPGGNFEVLVVNDGGSDPTEAVVNEQAKSFPAPLRVLTLEPAGPARARNAGIRAARGRIVAFTDDDCLPEPDWLSKVCEGYEQDDRLSGIGGQTLPFDPHNLFSRFQDLLLHQPHQDAGGISFLLTSNASFRRDRLLEVGGFDEIFPFAGGEDVDLCHRLRAKGYRLGYQPQAGMRHHNITTFQQYVKLCFRYGQGEAILHRRGSAGHKILRTLWWGRHCGSWLGLPWRARRLQRERGLSGKDAWRLAALLCGQDLIGYVGVLSQWPWIVKRYD
jgi:GT2 family glycosyltransferase